MGNTGANETNNGFVDLTEEQIKELKDKHGKIYRIKLEGGKQCWLKAPTRKVLSYAGLAGKQDHLKFNEVLLNQCWICGDEDIKTDDMLFLSVCGELEGIIEVQKASLEKY